VKDAHDGHKCAGRHVRRLRQDRVKVADQERERKARAEEGQREPEDGDRDQVEPLRRRSTRELVGGLGWGLRVGELGCLLLR